MVVEFKLKKGSIEGVQYNGDIDHIRDWLNERDHKAAESLTVYDSCAKILNVVLYDKEYELYRTDWIIENHENDIEVISEEDLFEFWEPVKS